MYVIKKTSLRFFVIRPNPVSIRPYSVFLSSVATGFLALAGFLAFLSKVFSTSFMPVALTERSP